MDAKKKQELTDLVKGISVERSTQQGVVRAAITRLRGIVKENDPGKVSLCEAVDKKLLEYHTVHDDLHRELRSCMQELGDNTVEIDAKTNKLTTDVAACHQDALAWQLKMAKKLPTTMPVTTQQSSVSTTGPRAAPVPVTGAGVSTPPDVRKKLVPSGEADAGKTVTSTLPTLPEESDVKDDVIRDLTRKLDALRATSDELEDVRFELSSTRSALVKQEESNDYDRDRYENMISQLKQDLSDQQSKSLNIARDLDDEKYRSDQLQSQVDAADRRESQFRLSAPRGESTRQSFDKSEFMDLTQMISDSNARIVRDVLNTSTEQNKSFIRTLQMPKIELHTFSGDMTEYHSFISRYNDIVGETTLSDAAKLNTLLQACSEEIRKQLDCCNYKSAKDGLDLALSTLKSRYGNPFLVAQAWVERIMDDHVLKKPAEILSFSCELRSCHDSLTSLGYLSDLDNTANLKRLVAKVPGFVQNRYRKKNRDNVKNNKRTTLEEFINIVVDAAEELADPVFGPESIKKVFQSTEKPAEKRFTRGRGSVNAAPADVNTSGSKSGTGSDKGSVRKLRCSFCQGEHYPRVCPTFTPLGPVEKLELVNSKRLCTLCLNPFHDLSNCVMRWTCQVDGCKARHNTKLHDSFEKGKGKSESRSETAAVIAEDSGSSSSDDSDAVMHSASANSYSLPIVPVHLGGKYRVHNANALIDTGATMTFMTRAMFDRTCVKPYKYEDFSMSTMGKHVEWNGALLNINIKAVDSDDWKTAYAVSVVDELPIASTYVERLTDLSRWPYLEKVKMTEPISESVDMLIGQSNAKLFKTVFNVEGPAEGMPYASRTPLGWVINGHYIKQPKEEKEKRSPDDPIFQYKSVNCCMDDGLEAKVDAFWKLEEVPDANPVDPVNVAIEEHWDKTAILRDGHLEVPMPLKCDPPNLPNNYNAVKKRFDSLTRRLLRDDDLRVQYCASMKAMFDKGYAEVCTEPPREGYLWYQPQQAVISERRPGKCRVVGDMSITVDGGCLNTVVHQGPNYTANITDVVTRFRMYRVALTGDVREMFSQVVVPEEQRDLLRFLWYKNDEVGGEIIECRMRTHPFGGIWCPAAAMYVYRWIVRHLGDDEWIEVIETLLRHFYVDDLLRSVTETSIGLRLIKEVRQALQIVGYDLVKIGSNDKAILESLPTELQAKAFQELELTASGDTVTYTLGSVWQPMKDVLSFRAIPLDKPFTRRGVLSTASSLYDPLGLIAPFVLKAKIFLQSICKAQLTWDEPIPAVYNKEWTAWLADVPLIGDFSVPRWLGITGDKSDTCQLHVFTDASQQGYGAAVYLVVESADGTVRSSNLVMSKAKVTPINNVTIPRLELSAAVLGVKLERAVRRMLNIPLKETCFWTDSMIVLWYVRGQAWKYKTFVANRVVYLQERTSVSQWFYVPTEENPADCISRGFSAKELLEDRIWTRGPEFLVDKSRAHVQPDMTYQGDKAEMKKQPVSNSVMFSAVKLSRGGLESRVISHYSRWNRMVRAVCLLRRFVKYWKTRRVKKTHYNVTEVRDAENVIFSWIQQECITDTQRKSKMFVKLFPFDDVGVLRVGGRLMMSSLTFEDKHPPILPDCHATRVFVKHMHERNGHAGIDRTYYDVRSRVWVLGGKTTIKSAIGRCVWCRRLRGKLSTQKMSPLPSVRVTAGTVPFQDVGVDYCGPFYVKVGRSMCKRYVCTITCLQTRAAHFEIAFFLTTSSFMHVLQRFIARRGRPRSILSDNGSNFIGAKRELREALQSFNSDYIGQRLAEDGIEWHFNVPLASHHGGVWERLNRSYRSTFQALARHQTLTDETLPTFAAATEQILNSRPLTRVSEDVDDLEVITPSHLLNLGRTTAIPGSYKKSDALRGHWKQIQYLGDLFWKRWTRTYLQSLQTRQKWTAVEDNLAVGEMVLVLDESAPRLEWPLARVLEVYPGRDGLVRSALLKTQTGSYKRPLTKILRLECDL